jgi:hypothetical protein
LLLLLDLFDRYGKECKPQFEFTKEQLYEHIVKAYKVNQIVGEAILVHPRFKMSPDEKPSYCQSMADILIKKDVKAIRSKLSGLIETDQLSLWMEVIKAIPSQGDCSTELSPDILTVIAELARDADSRAIFRRAMDNGFRPDVDFLAKCRSNDILKIASIYDQTWFVGSNLDTLKHCMSVFRQFDLSDGFVRFLNKLHEFQQVEYLSTLAFTRQCAEECSIDSLVRFSPPFIPVTSEPVSSVPAGTVVLPVPEPVSVPEPVPVPVPVPEPVPEPVPVPVPEPVPEPVSEPVPVPVPEPVPEPVSEPVLPDVV